MSNIINYLETELRAIDETGFSPVDSLILSELSYLRLDGAAPTFGMGEARIGELAKAELFESLLYNAPDRENNRQLIYRLAASPRFRDIPMLCCESHFDRELERQFAAVTFRLPDGTHYVAYRGTDTTIIGWKEDFNMAYVCPVPAQADGVRYLDAVGASVSGLLRVGGHSKGGNIAVYSAMMCSPAVRARISEVYSHDGPGFREEVISSPEFEEIRPLIRKTVPQSSLIGMLLQNQENFDVVESSYFWIMQHDPFSWRVDGGDFVYADKRSGGPTGYMNKTLNAWVNGLTDDERAAFVDTIYKVVSATGAETFADLSADWRKQARAILRAMKELDESSKKVTGQIVRELAVMAVKNLKITIEPPRLRPRRRKALPGPDGAGDGAHAPA